MIFIFSTSGSAVKASEQTANPPSKHDIALGGQVNLQGIILSSACDITAGDRWQSIEMAPETRGHMKRVGEGEPKPFSIHLTGCSLAAADDNPPWQYLRITFDGVDKNGLFQVQGAGGVALQLVDQNGDVVTPGKMIPYRIVSANDIQLDYQVRLKSTMENLLMGSYQTTIKYHVDYF